MKAPQPSGSAVSSAVVTTMVVVALVVGILSAGCTVNPASDSAQRLAEEINQGLNDRAQIQTDGWDAARYALSKSYGMITSRC